MSAFQFKVYTMILHIILYTMTYNCIYGQCGCWLLTRQWPFSIPIIFVFMMTCVSFLVGLLLLSRIVLQQPRSSSSDSRSFTSAFSARLSWSREEYQVLLLCFTIQWPYSPYKGFGWLGSSGVKLRKTKHLKTLSVLYWSQVICTLHNAHIMADWVGNEARIQTKF